jgi:hypothetical protein
MSSHLVIDGTRSAPLHDDGMPNYLAATLIDQDGQTHYALVDTTAFGDHTAKLDATDAHVDHELPGIPLPIDMCRRLAITSRKHLDDRKAEE